MTAPATRGPKPPSAAWIASVGRRRVPVTVAVLALLSSCGGQRVGTDLRGHMEEHFEAAFFMETAVIEGNLRAANSQGYWMAHHWEPPGMPLSVQPHLVELRYWGIRASEALTLEEAAEAAGRTILACGSCHERTGGGPQYVDLEAPPDDRDVRDAMYRHVWSLDLMSEALMMKSERAWSVASETLLASLVSPRQVDATDKQVRDMDPYVKDLADLARRARNEEEWLFRANTYGGMLATCSGCHGVTGVEPFGPPGG